MSDNTPYGHRKGYTPVTPDDDPARAEFLDDLAAAKGRAPFTWRQVLATPCDVYDKLNAPTPPQRPQRRK